MRSMTVRENSAPDVISAWRRRGTRPRARCRRRGRSRRRAARVRRFRPSRRRCAGHPELSDDEPRSVTERPGPDHELEPRGQRRAHPGVEPRRDADVALLGEDGDRGARRRRPAPPPGSCSATRTPTAPGPAAARRSPGCPPAGGRRAPPPPSGRPDRHRSPGSPRVRGGEQMQLSQVDAKKILLLKTYWRYFTYEVCNFWFNGINAFWIMELKYLIEPITSPIHKLQD